MRRLFIVCVMSAMAGSAAFADPVTPTCTGQASEKKLAGAGWADKVRAQHGDAEFRAGVEENILLRKNYQANGAFIKEDRPRTIDATAAANSRD